MNINETLKHYFGYDSLRPGQQELIEGILQRKDVLGIMPTGAGKSLCYQVPALMLDGITIVVSPLISLMTDQVKALNQAGVHAAYINSSLTDNQIRTALFYAAQGRYKIIYVAPERLNTIRFLEFACQVDISMVTVDEAHCISQWGQDFRPSYVGIADFLAQLPKRPVVSAFTATATERVKQDIMKSLRLQNPVTVVTGFDRLNLFFRAVTRKGGKEKDNSILNYVKKHEDESGIIYCATKKNVDKIYELLQQYGIAAGHYHAGLSLEERKKNQDDFTYDRIRVMVATNAFGMGIDKSNVRYVLHYNMPQSLEYYYQEAGRAGRDGEEAECVLFFSKQDIMINKRLLEYKSMESIDSDTQVLRNDYRKLNQMIDYCETQQCLRQFILSYFGDNSPCTCDKCSNCVVVEDEEEESYIQTKKEKKKAAFICVHNSCRSQIAEALGKHFASDVFESYSAGTETKEQINQDAVRLMKKRYGIDMEETQYSKLINQIPEPDIAISMGCNVECPFIGRPFDENWGLEDPTGKSDAEFEKIIDEIEANILKLKERLGKDVEECRSAKEQNV